MPNRSPSRPFVLIPLIAILAGCSPSTAFRALRPTPATAHERYARALHDAGLDSTALGREWLAASDSALRAPLVADLPARELGSYARTEARAVAYRLTLRDGQRLRADVRADGLPARLYLDLFEATSDTAKPFAHRATADTLATADSAATRITLAYEARRDGFYILRFQPELLRAGRYEMTLRIEPILAFPVEGGDNRSIQSGYGADRDAGSRSHEGIDIFAPRGTPVLAATAGTVRSLRPNSLGGNVVWLQDDARDQSLYYAHLDRHHVEEGQRVTVGDTLGFVGNTGNAATTRPHLHFGIYRQGYGAIDPMHWVRQVTAMPPDLAADTLRLGSAAVSRAATAPLRAGPSASSDLVLRVPRDRAMQIMGINRNWYRVQLDDGTAGYVSAAEVRMVEPVSR